MEIICPGWWGDGCGGACLLSQRSGSRQVDLSGSQGQLGLQSSRIVRATQRNGLKKLTEIGKSINKHNGDYNNFIVEVATT